MPIYKYECKDKKLYYFKTSIYGRSYCRRGFKTATQAREAESLFRKEITGTNYLRIHDLKTYREYLNEYLKYIKRNFKKTYSVNVERQIASYYAKLFPNVKIYQLSKIDAEKAYFKISKEKIKANSKNDKLAFIKRFFTWINKHYNFFYQAVFNLDPFRDYTIKKQKLKNKIVEFEDFKKIYSSCDDDYFKLALLTLFIYGFRLGELLALTVRSFDFDKNYFETYQAVSFKVGGKDGFVLIPPKTPSSDRINTMSKNYSDMVKTHIRKFNLKENEFIFFRDKKRKNIPAHENTFRRKLEKYCHAYNKDFHPHMLRTSIITHLNEKGVSIDDISKYIGHTTSKITKEYYLKTSNSKKEHVNIVIDEFLKKII